MEERFAVPGVGGIIEKQQDDIDYILMQSRCKKKMLPANMDY